VHLGASAVALLHARDLYKRVQAQVPHAKVIIGLWKFSGDPVKAAARLNIDGNDKLSLTLAQTVLQVSVYRDIEMIPQHAGVKATKSK